MDNVVNPALDLTLDPGDGTAAQFDRFRKVIFADVFVNGGSGQAGAAHDLFDADQLHVHDGLLMFVHDMTQASINLIRECYWICKTSSSFGNHSDTL